MLGTLAIVLAVVAAVSADCVPENPNVYWKTPCEGKYELQPAQTLSYVRSSFLRRATIREPTQSDRL